MFVLEAEPAATSALVNLFGVRVLEESLEWHPDPGECAFEEDELQLFRTGLRDLATPLLARLRAERSDPRDRTALLDFVERVEPVTELSLSCSLDGTRLPQLASRAYFVAPKSVSGEHPAFVVCSGPPWPPSPETAQALGMAIADTLGINMVETFIAFIQSDNYQRRRLLDIAGATGHLDDAEAEIDDENAPADLSGTEAPRTTDPGATTPTGEQPAGPPPTPGSAAPPPIPLLRFEDLRIDGVPFSIAGEGQGRQRPDRKAGERGDGSGSNGSGHRAAAGTDLGALDSLGMRIAVSFEMRRLHAAGVTNAVAVVDTVEATPAESLVVDVHSPEAIRTAEACSPVVRQVLLELEKAGVSRLFPGFDLLTIRDGRAERLIELKSSGVDARVQAMSWNEWKTARQSHLRSLFWLYLAGNLRADLGHASPYLRAINDPFGALVADVVEDHQVRRAVQLRVREFAIAEQLDITVESR